LVFCVEKYHAKLFPVWLSVFLYQLAQDLSRLYGIFETARLKRNTSIFDKGNTVDGNELIGGLVVLGYFKKIFLDRW
jgi:hypothetical protein